MSRLVFKRLVMLIPLLFGVSLFAFLLISTAPGDPVAALINPVDSSIDVTALEARRQALGLRDSLPVRYARWVGQLLTGNLGRSYATGRPVLAEMLNRVGATTQLAFTAVAVGLAIGVLAGAASALRRGTWLDTLITLAGFLVVATPPFFLGLALIFLLSLQLNLFPTGGMLTLGSGGGLGDRLSHLVMPAIVLALPFITEVTRYTRGGLIDVLKQDFIRTARGKGLRPRRVVLVHALRNALMPLVTITALALPTLLGGAIITETVFQWPGLGTLTIDAVHQRDYPIILAVTLFSALTVIAANLLADIAYSVVDPRVRYEP